MQVGLARFGYGRDMRSGRLGKFPGQSQPDHNKVDTVGLGLRAAASLNN